MKKLSLAVLFAFAFVTPAFANQCPGLISKAEETLKTAQLDDATKTKVNDLISKAKTEHEAGQHDQSVTDANEALKLLGVM